jgi:hypothetical protein
VEPDYLLDSEVCFSRAWTPFPNGGCGADSSELECYDEALQVDTKKKWEQGMKEEIDSLVNN